MIALKYHKTKDKNSVLKKQYSSVASIVNGSMSTLSFFKHTKITKCTLKNSIK